MEFPESVLITGVGGFIGSHLAERLLASGVRVIGIDNFCDYYNPTIKEQNIEACVANENFSLVRADITDQKAVASMMETHKPKGIVHLAARAGVRPSISDPVLYSQVNLEGTVTLLQAAVENGVERFLFASSSSVYGNAATVPFQEDALLNEPISPYAATKRSGELLCYTYWHLYKMPISCLRFFTVFGPRQRPDLAIHKFMRMIDEGESIPVFGDGSTSRDYTFIGDIVDGVCRALVNCKAYHIYNLGGSHPISLSDLIAAIEEAVGKKANINRLPSQPGDVNRTYADVTRASEELGYAPQVSIQEGLAKQWAWMQGQVAAGKVIV